MVKNRKMFFIATLHDMISMKMLARLCLMLNLLLELLAILKDSSGTIKKVNVLKIIHKLAGL